jgi:hypothetical protein
MKGEMIMKTYKVTYKETLVHTFYVETNNEESAKDAFEQDMMDGSIDFSGGEVDEIEYTLEELGEYIPSAENGDYSPSNPWDAPGMKQSDFI